MVESIELIAPGCCSAVWYKCKLSLRTREWKMNDFKCFVLFFFHIKASTMSLKYRRSHRRRMKGTFFHSNNYKMKENEMEKKQKKKKKTAHTNKRNRNFIIRRAMFMLCCCCIYSGFVAKHAIWVLSTYNYIVLAAVNFALNTDCPRETVRICTQWALMYDKINVITVYNSIARLQLCAAIAKV